MQDTNTITASFDDRDNAEKAIGTLEDAGISRSNIDLVDVRGSKQSTSGNSSEDEGLMASVKSMFTGSDGTGKDDGGTADASQQSGYMVSVRAPTADEDRVVEILGRDGSVKRDGRGESGRAEGGSLGVGSKGDMQSGETIEMVEEDMRVGKREVSEGNVRVSTHTVEDDVSEDVSLKTEQADIDRRPADRDLSSKDADAAFDDHTVEIEETREEAVVDKTARVTEEIHVGKKTDSNTETVTGTERHTEVEIDNDRDAADRSKADRKV